MFVFSGLERQAVNTQTASAALGDGGNIKVTVTRQGDNASVPGGQFSFTCDGENIPGFADNDGRDLDSAVGVFEMTPTAQELTDSGCATVGEVLRVYFSSSTGTYTNTNSTGTY